MIASDLADTVGNEGSGIGSKENIDDSY